MRRRGQIAAHGSPPSSSFISVETRLLADTLVFAPDGTGRGLLTAISRDLNTNIETPTRLVRTFQHTRDGERVLLDSLDCGPGCAISPRQARYALRDNWLEQTGLSGDWARCERVSP